MKPTLFESNPDQIATTLGSLKYAISTEQARLDAAPSLTTEELITAYAHARKFHEILDETVKLQYHIMNAYKESVIPAHMVEQGIKSASTETHQCRIKPRLTVSMPDKDAGITWLKENGLSDIVQETVSAGTLSKVAEERIKKNEDLPEDLFKTSSSYTTTLTALK